MTGTAMAIAALASTLGIAEGEVRARLRMREEAA